MCNITICCHIANNFLGLRITTTHFLVYSQTWLLKNISCLLSWIKTAVSYSMSIKIRKHSHYALVVVQFEEKLKQNQAIHIKWHICIYLWSPLMNVSLNHHGSCKKSALSLSFTTVWNIWSFHNVQCFKITFAVMFWDQHRIKCKKLLGLS